MRVTGLPVNVTISGYTIKADDTNDLNIYGILTCDAVGYPDVTYQWEWNDGIANQVSTGQTLTVTQLGLRNYTCTATNAVGSDSETIELGVTGSLSASRELHLDM